MRNEIWYTDLNDLGFKRIETHDPVLSQRTGEKSISMRFHLCKILEDEQLKSIDLEWSPETLVVGVYKDEEKLTEIDKFQELLTVMMIFDHANMTGE